MKRCESEVADAAHTMQATTAMFGLRIKREEQPQGDLFEQAKALYAYHVVASNWPEEKTAHEVLAWHDQRGPAEDLNTGLELEQMPC